MNTLTSKRKALEIDAFYRKEEILEMGMIPIKNPQMNIKVFEKDSKTYFFKHASKEILTLFCIKGKNSFYLS